MRNEFHVTKKMSTYLVAFVICDFKTKHEFTKTNNITVKVAVAEDKLEQADFALRTATNITEFYEQYFGIKYPLPKQGRHSSEKKKEIKRVNILILMKHL